MAERRKPDGLSVAQKKRLSRMIPVDSSAKEGELSAKGLPPIPDKLRSDLLALLNLGDDPNIKWQEAQAKGEVFYPPLVLAAQMVDEEFGTLVRNCKPQVMPIKDWIVTNYKDDINGSNYASMGLALVLKAYHLMYGDAFIEGFKNLNPDDIKEALSDETRLAEERYNLLSISTRGYRIPAHQFNLEFCLVQLGLCTMEFKNSRDVLDAGTAMFKVLDRNAANFAT